jgi:glycosyltransferase involved in cell wall biosynthesis
MADGQSRLNGDVRPVRVLYSFPHRIGAGRICTTAWHQVAGVAAAGVDVRAYPASTHRALPAEVTVQPTLARGSLKLPYRVVGDMRAFALHDRIVARRLETLRDDVDVVHTWPLGALRTLRTARELGIPTILERPNTHTRFAYEVVRQECERLGVALPPDQEHAFKEDVLAKEEQEYELADRLACPSDFVARTFLDEGFTSDKILRHFYGFDDAVFRPDPVDRSAERPFTMLFVGVAAVRKGLHFALEAWLRSPASRDGVFRIAGEILPSYGEKLADMLEHPSVEPLGHRSDVPALMRRAHVLVLPSIEEGSALVSAEALGSGCVPLVSEVSSGVCTHMENALVHPVGDVDMLAEQITRLSTDSALLARLRAAAIRCSRDVTWAKAGVRLRDAYRETVDAVPSAAGRGQGRVIAPS